MKKNVKLFGFSLTSTSALLLFILALLLVVFGAFSIVMELPYLDEWEYEWEYEAPFLIGCFSMVAIGLYVLMKTRQFKK